MLRIRFNGRLGWVVYHRDGVIRTWHDYTAIEVEHVVMEGDTVNV